MGKNCSTIQTVQNDVVAGDFNGTAWRCSNRDNNSTVDGAFAGCALPTPAGRSPHCGDPDQFPTSRQTSVDSFSHGVQIVIGKCACTVRSLSHVKLSACVQPIKVAIMVNMIDEFYSKSVLRLNIMGKGQEGNSATEKLDAREHQEFRSGAGICQYMTEQRIDIAFSTKEIMRESWSDHSLQDKVEADRSLPQRTPAMCVEFPLGGKAGRRHPCDGGCVKSTSPTTENWLRKLCTYSMNNNTSDEDKHDTNYINNNDTNTYTRKSQPVSTALRARSFVAPLDVCVTRTSWLKVFLSLHSILMPSMSVSL